MNERISRLVDVALKEYIYPPCATIELDPFDDKLSEPMMIGKRLTDYILAQPIVLTDDNEMIGLMRFNACPVPADIFHRTGHTLIREALGRYYRKPQENLCTLEWQHSNANFARLIAQGLEGYVRDINASRRRHLGDTDKLKFLAGLEMVVRALLRRAAQYRDFCLQEAAKAADPARRETLLRIARNVSNVPRRPAATFEEAIQCLYMCFCVIPDSIGRPDQYLYPLYRKGIDDGTLTREHATELIQELFVAIHGHTPHEKWADDKGAESHFVVGGLTAAHEDGYNELSDVIVDAMMDLPLVRPQVSLRWNRKTPRAVLRKLLDCERHDRWKRFAFVNDEPRIESLMRINGLPYEKACDYIMVGCNEPAFQGGISLGGNTVNLCRCLLNTLNGRRAEVLACADFEAFYAIFEEELHADLETMLDYSNRFNDLRSRDCNVLSSLFLDGCVERACSATRGGASATRGGANFMGAVNVIDSLTVIAQLVFGERRFTMAELLAALDADWQGHEDMRQTILRHTRFFGNNDELSDGLARRLYASVHAFAVGRTDLFGTPLTYGNLTGYNEHFAWFGAQTGATPDGRVAGAALGFGSGQAFGKDREGASAHLLSVARMDPTLIMCGNSIMNLTVDESTVRDDEAFEKLVLLVETYFKEGGLHLQLNHVSREELLQAQADPDAHKSLRVRVSGFSATFVDLQRDLQDNVIARTTENL